MAADIKQAYRRFFEDAWGRGNLAVFDELCDPACKFHDPFAGELDVSGAKQLCRMYREAFPDLKPTILASYADGDTAITRWRMTGTHRGRLMQLQPTGTRATVEGITLATFRNGKMVEDVVQWDALGLMRQLGASPALGATATAGGAEQPRPH